MPLGNSCLRKTLTMGGPCSGSFLYALWQMAQFAKKTSRPCCSCAVSGRDRAEEFELQAVAKKASEVTAKMETTAPGKIWKPLLNHLLSASIANLESASR
jgi:hypothetical protein